MGKKETRWEKLDNTAHLFPVISGEKMTNVYRISVRLKEEIQPQLLQEALNMVLPKIDGFNLRLRRGIFWYYFEENNKPAPKVREESGYPCRYIVQNKNRSYLFRVTYYQKRIHLEVFHALADGMGAINFLKELTYQYLRLAHEELRENLGDELSIDTSLNREDSFLQYYRKEKAKKYATRKAYLIKGEQLKPGEFGVIHGFMPIPQLKEVCHRYGVSINEYLVTVFAWAVYVESCHKVTSKTPIRVAVPVNLRPFFESVTTKNFFVPVTAEFIPEDGKEYNFEEMLEIMKSSLRAQINKEHLEELFSYNVSNEMNIMARAVPLFIKNIAIKSVYTPIALANTSTVTNVGNVVVKEAYQDYIDMFTAMLPMSVGQNLKGTICSFNGTLSFTFTSVLKETLIQRSFFRQLSADGIDVEIETNGVYYG